LNLALAQREVMLAGVALLAAVLAVALASPRGPNSSESAHLQPVFVPGGGWYTALAGARPMRYGTRTDCGVLLRPQTRGIVDSVLPCNVKLFVSYGGGERVLTQVIARRPVVPGRRFDVTPALAEDLGMSGIDRIKWVYAR
jgi:hypothetical protein